MSAVLERIERLFPYAYSITGEGNDAALPRFLEELPFEVRSFESGGELNGWQIPHVWKATRAEIRKDGDLIYDGLSSPLGVVWLSPSFSGRLTLDELRPRLFYSDAEPDAVPYHWGALYRPAARDWGFCLTKHQYESLQPGTYEVELETETRPGTMKVLDYVLPGESEETVLLNAHNCHPFQANDDLSGCAVGIELIKRLAERDRRRLTYRLVIAPELVGTVYWLDSLGDESRNLKYALLLKAVGNDASLKLQESFGGDAAVDQAAHNVFRHRYRSYESGPFRTVYGNDETVFEAPGYEIPTVSITRMPFSAYHTDHDTPDRLSADRLEDATVAALEICLALERNISLEACFKGLISLSNPKYDLYKAAPAPGLDGAEGYDIALADWNLLMNCMPRYLDGKTTLLEVANKHNLPIAEVHAYAEEWVAKGLARVKG